MSFLFYVVGLSICLAYVFMDMVVFVSVARIKKEKKHSTPTSRGISVIIAAKDDARNLKKYLASVLNQHYPLFEVIVVNDHSRDQSSEVLKDFEKQYDHLKTINLNNACSSKKNAISEGIKHSMYDTLCFTDADCFPKNNEWLKTMSAFISDKTPIVLGYSPYKKQTGLLNKLIRFETLQTAINYFGFANINLPYMGVGRNLMYKKEVFTDLNGFKNHLNLLSGDDDLLVNNAVKYYKVGLCLKKESFVLSEPETSLSSWYNQKKRHYSTSYHYQWKHQFLLGFQFLVRFLFWYVMPIGLLLFYISTPVKTILWIAFFSAVVINTLGRVFVYKKFESRNLAFESTYLESLLLLLQLCLFFSQMIKPKKNW